MVGGSIVLGVAAGTVKGADEGKKALDIDLLGLNIACRNLPILLATGRKLQEMGYKKIPEDIKKLIFSRYQESEARIADIDGTSEDFKKRKIGIEATTKIYKTAFAMAQTYDWVSAYDVFSKVF